MKITIIINFERPLSEKTFAFTYLSKGQEDVDAITNVRNVHEKAVQSADHHGVRVTPQLERFKNNTLSAR